MLMMILGVLCWHGTLSSSSSCLRSAWHVPPVVLVLRWHLPRTSHRAGIRTPSSFHRRHFTVVVGLVSLTCRPVFGVRRELWPSSGDTGSRPKLVRLAEAPDELILAWHGPILGYDNVGRQTERGRSLAQGMGSVDAPILC